MRVEMPAHCPCPTCTAEGQHDPWCTVHLADYEHLTVPPCDCGVRSGERRQPANAPQWVHRCDEPPNWARRSRGRLHPKSCLRTAPRG